MPSEPTLALQGHNGTHEVWLQDAIPLPHRQRRHLDADNERSYLGSACQQNPLCGADMHKGIYVMMNVCQA